MMSEGAAALGKLRFFLYLIFLFDVLLMFRGAIEGAFHYEGNRVLYGLILMIAAQATVASMHIVKFASTLPNAAVRTKGSNRQKKQAEKENRRRENALRLSARIRYFILFQYAFLAVYVLNHVRLQSGIVESVTVLFSVAMILVTLRDLTLLQKGEY